MASTSDDDRAANVRPRTVASEKELHRGPVQEVRTAEDIKPSLRNRQAPPVPPRFFHFVYWAFFSAVFVLLAILLFRPLFFSVPNWLVYIQHVAFAVVSVCFGLWIGDSAHYLTIREDLRAAIFSTFVAVILSAAGGYVASIWNRPPELQMRVEMFDEQLVEKQPDGKYLPAALLPRPNLHYRIPAREKVRLFVGVVVQNFTVDMRGRNDMELLIQFSGGGSTLADVGSIDQNDPSDWATYPFTKTLTREVVEATMKLDPQETLFLLHLQVNPDALKEDSKTGSLRIIARDRKTGASSSWQRQVTLELNALN